MGITSTFDLVEKIIEMSPQGFQLSIRHGILNSTKCIFYKNGLVFLFDVSEKFVFEEPNGIELEEFIAEYKHQKWFTEMIV